jgi:acetyl-CoA carboxylase carboxyl transferase subunit beta
MVDMVVHRHKIRATLANLCRILTKTAPPPRQPSLPPPAAPGDVPAAEPSA